MIREFLKKLILWAIGDEVIIVRKPYFPEIKQDNLARSSMTDIRVPKKVRR